MIEAQLPDGTILEFPDGTPPAVVQRTVKRQLGVEQAEPDFVEGVEGLPEAAGPEAVPSASEIFGLDPAIKERPAVLPIGANAQGGTDFVAPEAAVDALNAVALPGRILQGHVPSREELINFTAATVGGPIRGAITGARRALGVDTAETLARQQRFEEQGIPATRGDITQDFAQQAEESRLVGLSGGADAEPLRQARLEQSEAFIGKANELVDSLGVPPETGDRVKDALSGRIDLLRDEKNALYKEVADAAPEIANAPILTDDIVAVLPNKQTEISVRRSSPQAVDSINEALVEFGLDASEEAVEAFAKKGGEVTPLTLGNFDEFRKELNRIQRAAPPEQKDNISRITGPIQRALDEEAGFIDAAVRDSGVTDQSIVNTLKEARARVRTLRTEFSPQAIAGRLTGFKRDGITPIVEASKVSSDLLRPGAPIENLQRTITSLRNSGKKGAQAIGDLQASVVSDALEAALKAPSRKTSGVETVGGNQFAKALDRFGDDKLDLLFKNNPQALKALRDLKQTGLDISPTAGAVPKGSGSTILNILNTVGGIPGLGKATDIAKLLGSAGQDARATRRALENPRTQDAIRAWSRAFPAISRNLGLLTILPEPEPISNFDDQA